MADDADGAIHGNHGDTSDVSSMFPKREQQKKT